MNVENKYKLRLVKVRNKNFNLIGCASAPLRSAPHAYAPLLAGARQRCAQQDIPNPYINIRMVNK